MQNHVVKGFRKCGLYPFNPDSVGYTKCVKNVLEKHCQKQTVSTSVSEETFTINDFETAIKVIDSISNDLKNYGVNVDVVINEIDFHKSSMKKDSNKVQPSSSTCSTTNILLGETVNIGVGSIVPISSVTLLPIDVMGIEEDLLLHYETPGFEISSELENLPKTNYIDTVDEEITNKSKIASENMNKKKYRSF